MFGPLNLVDTSKLNRLNIDPLSSPAPCMFCNETFDLIEHKDDLFCHLFKIHRLVIADAGLIADLQGYLKYWKHRFSDNSIQEFCTTLVADKDPNGVPSKNEQYFLLSDVLMEDKTLRQELQRKQLDAVLKQQTLERCDTNFKRDCFFCRLEYNGTRIGYFQHLSEVHNLQLGKPDNLVHTDVLLDTIQKKMDTFECIYCEKVFKNRSVLKEHMRKKQHKRVNPLNKDYDKFYIVNYLEIDKNLSNIFKEKDGISRKPKYTYKPYQKSPLPYDDDNNKLDAENTSDKDSDSEWSEWKEDDAMSVICLFCDKSSHEYNDVLVHMRTAHRFDFDKVTGGLDFYQKIKCVNYIRRQMYVLNCVSCDVSFDTRDNLLKHMCSSNHINLSGSVWDQPEYYFPTYENDLFLCYLEDNDNQQELDVVKTC